MRARDLRRLRRPDEAQALPGALLARVAPLAARAHRDRRRRAHGGERRQLPRGDEARRRSSPRRVPAGRRDWLAERTRYVATDFADEEGQELLAGAPTAYTSTSGTRATGPHSPSRRARRTLIHEIGEHRTTDGWTRLIIEKPFGRDLASAEKLNALLQERFDESEVFRIDHYLGKETVQNLLALRFANGIFEPIWNRQFVDQVEITVAESIGIEGRAAFYESAGAIRDVFQNHLLQLVALTAMEPPIDFTAESVRNEKVKVLRAMNTPGSKHVVRGQYGPGFVEGEEVPGYRDEMGVARDSMTETFVAAKLFVDNWRWADTPFYLRAGKRLARRETTIAIEFKRAPHPPFEDTSAEKLRPNVLVVHIQPDEGVSLELRRRCRDRADAATVHGLSYGGAFAGIPEAYERLILDCLVGDATLFTRSDEVEGVVARGRDRRVLKRTGGLPELRGGHVGRPRRTS